MKKLISLLMALVVVLTCFPANALNVYATPEVEGAESEITAEPEMPSVTPAAKPAEKSLATRATTSGTTGLCWWELDGTVLTIGGKAATASLPTGASYGAWKTVTEVIIKSGVTEIGDRLFSNCSAMTKITIPDTVTAIGKQAFDDCSSLTSIKLPNGITSISEGMFSGCTKLSSVTIPSSVRSIGEGAFYVCSSLSAVTIPNGVLSIEKEAFAGCSSLTTISFPNSVTSIHASALNGCTKLHSITVGSSNAVYTHVSGVLFNKDKTKLLRIPQAAISSQYTIAKTVTEIGDYAFYGYTSLEIITIPNGVTKIGDYAFNGCSSLKTITFADSVAAIGDYAFLNCTSLTGVKLPEGVTEIGYGTFSGCSSLKNVTFPAGLTRIGSSAFYNCSVLTGIAIPEDVISIGSGAFNGCKRISSVVIPKGVTKVENNTFYNCSNLTTVTLPANVTHIGERAFYYCSRLSKISIPNSVIYIGANAFSNCSSKIFTVDNNGYYVGNTNNPYLALVNLASKAETSLVIHKDTKLLAAKVCENYTKLTSVTIPDGLQYIGDNAFLGCIGLTGVVIPDSVIGVGVSAFASCNAQIFQVYNNGNYLGNEANPYKVLTGVTSTGLTAVDIHQDTELIAGYAFGACSKLTSVAVPDGVTYIGEKAFYGCTKLATVTIPDTVTRVENAFGNCTALTYQTYQNGKYLGNAQNPYVVLVEVVSKEEKTFEIHPDTKVFLSNAFTDCSCLTKLSIPGNVVNVGNGTFADCVAIERIEVAQNNPNYCSIEGKLYNKDGTQLIWKPMSHKQKLSVNYFYVNGEKALDSVTVYLKPGAAYDMPVPEVAGYSTKTETISGTMPAEDLTVDVVYYENEKVTDGSCNEQISWALYADGKLVLRGIGAMPDYAAGTAPWAAYADQILTVYIDSRITMIGSYAFYNCTGLYFVEYGYSVTVMGEYAFAGCTALTSFKLPGGLTAIPNGAFYGCTGLSSLVIPDGIVSIGDKAFYGCDALVQATIGGAVTQIGIDAFAECDKLTQIYFRGAPAALGANALGSTNGKYVYYYSTVSGWEEQITDSKWNGYLAIPYNAVAQQNFDPTNPYIIKVVDKNGLPLRGAIVMLGDTSYTTNAEGMAYFAKPTQAKKLEVTCKGHIPFVDETFTASATQYMDLVELTDSPSSVQGLRVNGKSVATTVAVVNCAEDENVNIAVRGHSPKYTILRYELYQGGRLIATEKTARENCTFNVKASAFEEGQTVLVRMYTSDGSMVAAALNMDVIKLAKISQNQILGELSRIDLSIGLGGMGSYKIPINPQSAGNEKIYTSIKDRTIRIGVNLDVGEIFEKNDEKKAKTVLHKMVQDSMNNFAKTKPGFEYNLCGYIEIEYLGNDEYYVKTCYVKLGLNAKLSFNAQASYFGVVGVYFRASVSAGCELDLHITHFSPEAGFRVDDLNFAVNTTLELAGGAYVLFGIGSAEIYGSLNMGFQLGIVPELEMESVYITGQLGVRWSILWGLRGGEAVLLKGDIYHWPEERAYKELVKRFHAMRNDPQSYTDNDRAYLEKRTAWLTGEEGYLQKNVYDRIDPKIVTCGDTTMMVWLDDNSQRGNMDYQTLYYSVYSDGVWSVPIAVDDNGTFDCEFDVCTDGAKIYVIYTEMNSQSTRALKLSEQNDLNDLVGGVEVKVAVYENGRFAQPISLTDNAACELLPGISSANGVITATWQETSAVGVTGDVAGGTVYTAMLTDSGWSVPMAAIASQNAVSQILTLSLGTELYTAYITDADGNGETTDDQLLILRTQNGEAVQLDAGTVANAQQTVIDGENALAWYRDGRIYLLTDLQEKPVALTAEAWTVGSDYRILSTPGDRTLVLFVMRDPEGNGSDLYSVYVNGEGYLTQPVRMTQTDGYITNYDVTFREDRLLTVYTQTCAEISGESMETTTHLAAAELRFATDITLESVTYDVTDGQPLTEMPISLIVTNSGTQNIDGIKVELYHQEQLLYTTNCQLPLVSGATEICEATVILPGTIEEAGYSIRIVPELATDANPEDNRMELTLAYADLAVEAEQKIVGTKNYISLSVSNFGNSETAATLTIHASGENARQLAELDVETIAAGEIQQYLVDVSALMDAQDQLVTCAVAAQLLDPCQINDTATMKLLCIQEDAFVADPERVLPNPELSISAAEFDRYTPADITVTILSEAAYFTEVEGLTKDTDYTFRNGELVIGSDYLRKLDVGNYTLNLRFDLGAGEFVVRTVYIQVIDSAPIALSGSVAISGQPVAGNTVYADISGLEPKGCALTYTWLVDGEIVSRTSSYEIQLQDLHKTLQLTVAGAEGYTGSVSAEATVGLYQPEAPAAPMVSKLESNTVALVKVEGIEYSMDGTSWQQSSVFTDLEANESYTFYARKAATETQAASAAGVGLTVTTPKGTVAAPNAPELAEKTYYSITLVADPAMEYRMGDGQWTQNPVFPDLQSNTTYVFWQRYRETERTYASPASQASFSTDDRIWITGSVVIQGAPYYGQTLTAQLQNFPGDAQSLTYQWYIDGVAAEGATGNTYTIAEADMGKTVEVRIAGIGAYQGEMAAQLHIYTYIPGDVNGDLSVNVDDAIYLLRYIFVPSRYPINQSADMDGNGRCNSDDAIYLLQHILVPDVFQLV